MISIIAAMDEKRGIGKDNKIPWHIPQDFKRFKNLTTGHPIIMGRKTFESILSYNKGKPLPNRTSIVITRDRDWHYEGIIVTHSLKEAIRKAQRSIQENPKIPNTVYRIPNTNEDEIFIIGGGQVFKEALPLVDRLYLTIVKARRPLLGQGPGGLGDFSADTFFPDYSEFKKVLKKEAGKSGEYEYTFLDLEK